MRGWRRRFGERAEEIRVPFTELALRWGPELAGVEARGSPELHALEAIGLAAAAAVRQFGQQPLWSLVAADQGAGRPRTEPRKKGCDDPRPGEVEHVGDDGRRVQVSPGTLRRWLRHWRQGGFQALLPGLKLQPNRTPAAVLEAALTLKREAPGRTAAHVTRLLAEAQVGQVSSRTLHRHFARLGLSLRPDGSSARAHGRFEATEFGELWTGDGLHGPVVAGAKAILFAFIDDWSGAVVGWRWGQAEDTVRLEAAFRRGLESAGVPQAVFVDRGSAFVSAAFHRTLATLGIRIIHSRAGYPASRGKIERFFATVRSQFLVELDARGGARDLSELNEFFAAWLEGVYHRTTHSETKQTPLERRLAGPRRRRPSPAELHEAFLWSETRLVSKTASVSLFGNQYEVDPALVGVKVQLLFDPFDLSQIEVRYRSRPIGPSAHRPPHPPGCQAASHTA